MRELAGLDLADSRAQRDQRLAGNLDQELDTMLATNVPNYQLVTPEARLKLRGILAKYAKEARPFTACVRDNRRRFGPRVNKVCAVVTDLVKNTTYWRGKNGLSLQLSESEQHDLLKLGMSLTEEDLVMVAYSDDHAGDEFAVVGYKERQQMPDSAFAMPKERQYLMHDRLHGIRALGRSKGKPEEARVKAAVCKAYGDLPSCQTTKGSGS